MNAKDILLLGLKSRVTAISRKDGQQIWSTELPVKLLPVTLLAESLSQ